MCSKITLEMKPFSRAVFTMLHSAFQSDGFFGYDQIENA